MENTYLNLISVYALEVLRNNLVKSGYIEQRKINSVTPESRFGSDIKTTDSMDNYEIVYFMENGFNITLPDDTQLTTVGALCNQVAKMFYAKNKNKLNAISNHIAKDVVNMAYTTVAIHDSIPALNVARNQKITDVLSKSTPDYDLDLLLKSIESKYNVNINKLYKNITTIDSLIQLIALEIEKANRYKTSVKQAKYIPYNPYDNARHTIFVELESELKAHSLIDPGKKQPAKSTTEINFNNFVDYITLSGIAEKKYNIKIDENTLFNIKNVHEYCDAIMKKRIAVFQATKQQNAI